MRNTEKEKMLLVILSYIFGDTENAIIQELNEFKIEFVRPSGKVFRRYVFAWTELADFEVWMITNKTEIKCSFPTSKWIKVGGYLRSNVTSTRRVLKINSI